jgi:hypothetical protein
LEESMENSFRARSQQEMPSFSYGQSFNEVELEEPNFTPNYDKYKVDFHDDEQGEIDELGSFQKSRSSGSGSNDDDEIIST